MPINDLPVCSDKLQAKSNGDTSKGSQLELQVLLSPVNISKANDNLLLKHQGQRWHHVFDFDRIIKQLRVAEKCNLKGKGESYNNLTQSFSPNSHLPSPPKMKCVQKIKQVLRLSANDMHYYGLVPKTKSENVVVCNICLGIYTRSGFNNHMLIQHPTAWNTVSPKLISERVVETLSHSLPDIILDGVVKNSSSNEIESSNDISILTYNNPSRHKSSKNGSMLGSNSSSNNGSRSRSKSKHHSTTSDSSISISSSTEVSQNSNKSSRKPLENIVNVATQPDLSQSITYSSSNSSCSLPTAQKNIPSISDDLSGPLEKKFASNSVSFNERKNHKGVLEKLVSSVCLSKKKDNNTTFAVQESLDSSTSSSSSDVFGITSSGGTNSTKSSGAAAFDTKIKIRNESVQANYQGSTHRNHNENQLELDQAVSSIVYDTCKSNSTNIGTDNSKMSASNNLFGSQPISDLRNELLHTTPASNISQEPNSNMTIDNLQQQNSLDESSISTLDDVLDPKFINEILNTAETEINFDEIEPTPTSQPDYIQQQPSVKRMRYADISEMNDEQAAVSDQLRNEYSLFPQQHHQPQQRHQQYSIDDIKMYNSEQQEPSLRQQPPFTEIDAMQLQQLLYQQQSLNDYEGDSVDEVIAVRQNQLSPQYSEKTFVDSKQLIQLCDNDNKNSKVAADDHSNKFATVSSIHNEYINTTCPLAANIEIFSMPSITEDIEEEPMISNINHIGSTAEQYVTPQNNDNLIYEITGNNHVSVMSQQRQQQVIADFLNRTVYGSVDQVSNASNNETSPVMENIEGFHVLKDEYELFSLNFGHIDTAASLMGNSTGSSSLEPRKIRTDSKCNYNEDFYFNVHTYSGIPKPISINSFGLVKLPSGTATTFRKNLLTTRKANNSWLNGSVNSIVGSNASAGIRLAGLITKNCFSTNGSVMNNLNPANEIISGTSSNGSVTPPMSIQRNRFKATANLNNIVNSNYNVNLMKNKAPSSTTITTPINRIKTKPNAQISSLNSKTIYVNNASNSSNRIQYIKRSIIPKANVVVKKPNVIAKHLADLLNNGCQSSLKKLQLNQTEIAVQSWGSDEDDLKPRKRTDNFYERRRKLLNLTNSKRFYPFNLQNKTGHQLKTIYKKNSKQNLSDCFYMCNASQLMNVNNSKSIENIRVIA